ncbi:MAG TPA: segregation/condensation protein A [Candidatus Acidoferrum sp.]|nr:segregation/condensation protein A [Candidatus Acidoferrum sp.]
MNSGPEFSLPGFAGPLDVLLSLVRRNEVAIEDLPIAAITRQYLDFMDRAAELDIDLGADFAHMAATLIQIKSRSLLPALPAAIDGPDPREELIRELLDHEELQRAAGFLQEQLEVSGASWSRPSIDEFRDRREGEAPEEPTSPMSLAEILRLAREALEAARAYNIIVPREAVSVEDRIRWLAERLAQGEGDLELEELLAEQPDRAHGVALFLGVLELSRRGVVRLAQDVAFGPCTLSRCAAH